MRCTMCELRDPRRRGGRVSCRVVLTERAGRRSFGRSGAMPDAGVRGRRTATPPTDDAGDGERSPRPRGVNLSAFAERSSAPPGQLLPQPSTLARIRLRRRCSPPRPDRSSGRTHCSSVATRLLSDRRQVERMRPLVETAQVEHVADELSRSRGRGHGSCAGSALIGFERTEGVPEEQVAAAQDHVQRRAQLVRDHRG